jgi:hypothetical protein
MIADYWDHELKTDSAQPLAISKLSFKPTLGQNYMLLRRFEFVPSKNTCMSHSCEGAQQTYIYSHLANKMMMIALPSVRIACIPNIHLVN